MKNEGLRVKSEKKIFALLVVFILCFFGTNARADSNWNTMIWNTDVWFIDGDADGDGVADSLDAFPNDIAASVDTDGDGYPDGWNGGYGPGDSTTGLTLDSCPSSLPIRVVGGADYWEGLQHVYDWVIISSGTIQTHSYLADGPLLLDAAKTVTFQGGFNCDFSNNSSSPSTIQSLTIDGGSGQVTIDNIEVR